MDGPLDGPAAGSVLPDGRLESWKGIAAYLSRDVTTVQRWEKREGMPVHRHVHDRMGSVYAFRAELDAWLRTRHPEVSVEALASETSPSPPASAPRVRPRLVAGVAVAAVVVATGAGLWFRAARLSWRSPIADARFERVTDFDGVAQAAAVSRDGRFVAFLSDREGRMDVWVTQAGSGQFHNLTHGTPAELVNPSVRMLGFSPDGSLVTFWARSPDRSGGGVIGIWAVPTLGGQPRMYLEGSAECEWSADGGRLVYHTPDAGDPMFVTDANRQAPARLIFTAPAGLHAHFPTWAPDGRFIYFVSGSLPEDLDLWRISPSGGGAERITSHHARVSHPVLLDARTLVYLATDPDGSGPWLYGIDVEGRVPHKLSVGVDRYTSLSASSDGQRLVATLASPKRTLWRLPVAGSPSPASAATRVPMSTSSGFCPRLGPGYLLFVSASAVGESIWKAAGAVSSELWAGKGVRILGGPAISPDGQRIAFSVRQQGQSYLYVMQADGTGVRLVCASLDLQGSPAWASDGQSLTSAAVDQGEPRLFRVPLDGRPASPFLHEYSIDPAWAPDGRFLVYSGPDVGATISLRAATADALPHPLRPLNLVRGARRVAFLPGRRQLVVLRGEIQHKDLWLIDLDTGAERQLTTFGPDFAIRDFDISPDGRELVLERVQEQSDVVLLDLRRK
jgi:Tol biopolymer transport system component